MKNQKAVAEEFWVLPEDVFDEASKALNYSLDMINAAKRSFAKAKMRSPKSEKEIDALTSKANAIFDKIEELQFEMGNNSAESAVAAASIVMANKS